MPNANQYQQLIESSPNLQKFLNLIGWAEGADYNVGFGGRVINDLSWHPYNQRQFRVGNSTTSAAGKYQFERSTWDSVASRLGLTSFSPTNQDIAAVALIDQRGALSDVLNGNVTSAVSKTRAEWQGFVTRPIDSIVSQFNRLGGSTVNSANKVSAAIPADFKDYLGVEVIGARNRYLIAFAILAIIFIFAFN